MAAGDRPPGTHDRVGPVRLLHVHARIIAAALPAISQRWSPRLWAILLVLCGALFLDALDVSMVVVALPAIRAGAAVALTGLHRRVPPGGGESVPVVAGRTPGCGSPGAVAAHRRD